MDDTQHFCLRWNNYQSSITSAFENLRDDEAFVDVTLACEGRSIKAHRVVLSACSPYFRELLKSTPCKHPVILLQDVNFMDLHALVEFIYHGEVNVHQKSLQSFLKTAEVLRVSGLTQQQAEDTHSHLAQIQNLANSGGRTPLNTHTQSLPHPHHGSLHDDGGSSTLFSRQGAGSPPPTAVPSLPSHINNQLLKRMAMMHRSSAAAAAEETSHAFKRLRGSDNSLPLSGAVGSGSNNNSPDLPPLHARSASPQQTPADFSTIKHHNNNNTPPLKEEKRNGPTGNGNSGNGNGNGNGASNGNGISISDKLGSLTPSPLARAGADDVKSEPMDMVCSNNNANANDEHSNDSTGEHDANRSSSGDGGKGSLSSGNDEEIGDGLASHHAAPQFIMSPAENKMFHAAAFNFPNIDPSALLGLNTQLQQSGDLAVSPQGPHSITRSAATSPTSSTSSPPSPPTALISPTSSLKGSLAAAVYSLHSHAHGHVLGHATSPPRPGSVGSSVGSNLCTSTSMGCGVNSGNNSGNNNGNNANNNSNNGNATNNNNNSSSSSTSPGSQATAAGGTVTQAGTPPLPLRMPPPTSGGINEPQECPYCRRTFSCYYSLKRHFQDKHEQSDTLYVCEFCHRRYRTKNSLTTHKSLQHRGSSGMLKRLLKTTAIKHGLVGHGHGHGHVHHPHAHHHALSHPRTSLYDFTSELGQPPPGIQ
uniref:Broad, isoform S n=2 Tax=Drosophila melanogaster TaxID=7227 RepID=A0ACD4DAS8_DROME|nr:broad, isoform S [Drosophila melanogaster]NP_726750.1 broad, isoform A [Drosophila melanogaster]AAF45651.2 broad, isoform A [Drosophila melanogaster]UYK33047.1 broad, isoform S [Drosophila melanogaster]CAA15628.1 EG:17A9.1 [Drosophila melanogaster]|eukprot:NP_726750.1 broad, isoform A [Drosophila melanogaster]